jgi:transcriptional regulator GlxA family with amidase domain
LKDSKTNHGEKVQFFVGPFLYPMRYHRMIFREGRTIMASERTIGIVVFDGVLTAEVTGPAEVFGMAAQRDWFSGSKVLLIGIESQATHPTVRTEEGLRLTVDATIADDLTLDVLLVPGGNDMDHLLQHEALNAFIRKHEEAAQWVGSVCAGAFVLGSAGVLDGKRATTWFGGESSLQEQFPAINVVTDKPVVLDHRRFTANGGLVSYRASLIVLGQMTSPEHAKEIHRSLNMDRLGTWVDIEADIHAAVAEAR